MNNIKNYLLKKVSHIPKRTKTNWDQFCFLMKIIKDNIRMAQKIIKIRKKIIVKSNQANLTVVINTIRSFNHMHVELFLAYLLAISGQNVYILFDDGILAHWDFLQIHQKSKYLSPYLARWFIKLSHLFKKFFITKAYNHKNIKVINYSKIVKKIGLNLNIEDSDKQYAISSTKRFFETGKIEISNIDQKAFYKKSLQNCKVSKSIGKYVVDVIAPELFITSHGIYSLWGPAFKIMQDAGIHVIVYSMSGQVLGKIRLEDQIIQLLLKSNRWNKFSKNELKEENTRKAIEYLESRICHNAYDVKEYFGDKLKYDKGYFVNKKGKKVFGLFPNVIWDGDIPERNTIFSGLLDWCTSTVNSFRNNNNELIIRFHPSENSRLLGTKKLEEILLAEIPDIRDIKNINLISSEEKMDTYQFAKRNIDIGLIYDGTLALELPYLGIPVIACGYGSRSNPKVVFQPETRGEYFNILKNPSLVLSKFQQEKEERLRELYKYVYWLYFESLYDLPFVEKPFPVKINYDLLLEEGTFESFIKQEVPRIVHRLVGYYF